MYNLCPKKDENKEKKLKWKNWLQHVFVTPEFLYVRHNMEVFHIT